MVSKSNGLTGLALWRSGGDGAHVKSEKSLQSGPQQVHLSVHLIHDFVSGHSIAQTMQRRRMSNG